MPPDDPPARSKPGATASGSGAEFRHARAPSPRSTRAEHCWAFIVGISAYKHADGQQLKNLRHAVADAKELAQLLQLPSCGDVDPNTRMQVLLDQDATRDAIVGDLREFLRRPAPGDLVILYFACHGMPDPDPKRSTLVYLVAHDTDVAQIARTGVPLREIIGSVDDYLERPQRVLLIADTCYSGALLVARPGYRGVEDEAERAAIVSQFFEKVGQSRPGMSVLASAGARQGALEGDRWSGHGVFTHYLLRGLKGEADRNPIDNRVTVDELFSYVKENVERDTAGGQHPVMSIADPDLVLAYTAGLVAEEHLAIGRDLLRMALLLDDKARFMAAVHELELAVRAAAEVQRRLPEAQMWRGIAKLMAGEAESAVTVLDDAVAHDDRCTCPPLHYYLGLARLMAGNYADAFEALDRFQRIAPDDERARWAPPLVARLAEAPRKARSRRRALLIGVQNYQHTPMTNLRGPENDIRLLKSLLVECCGFDEVDIQVLFNQDATRSSVLDSLRALADSTAVDDVALVYFSGHSTSGSREDYLIVHDTRTLDTTSTAEPSDEPPPRLENAITSHELHGLFLQIHAASQHAMAILDTHPNDIFIDLARSASYTVLLAASPGQNTYEFAFDEQGKTTYAGLLTYPLVQRIRREGTKILRGQLVSRLVADIQTRNTKQTPYFIGAPNLPFFPPDPQTNIRILVDFSLRRTYGAFDHATVEGLYESALASVGDLSFPDLYISVGRAFLELGDPLRAHEALERAYKQVQRTGPDLLAPLGIARLAAGRIDDALEAGIRLAASVELPEAAAELAPQLERLKVPSGAALIVGIEKYRGPEGKTRPAHGAVDDARWIQDRLAGLPQFGADRSRLLLDADATREAILDGFEWLCNEAGHGPAVFYFAGNGSAYGDPERPTLVSADGRTEGVFDISLDELVRIAGAARANLVTLLDARFRPLTREAAATRGRFVPPDLRPTPSMRDLGPPAAPLQSIMPAIGIVTSFFDADSNGIAFTGSASQEFERWLQPSWATEGSDWLAGRLAAGAAEDTARFFAELSRNRVIEEKMTALFRRAERQPIARAASLLGRLIEKRGNQDPDGRVSRGVAYGLLGDLSLALADLDVAIQLFSDAGRSCFEARYHYGRLLVESKRDPARAMSELEKAVEEQPNHPGARYFLGVAIRQMIEQQWLERVGEHWRRYVELGAPLGHLEEVSTFLGK